LLGPALKAVVKVFAAHDRATEIRMNKIRERVKFNVPAVVLTLLGIVQAFALELLWTFIAAEDALVTFYLEGAFLGLQSLSIFSGDFGGLVGVCQCGDSFCLGALIS
jgi:hypothetical protein